MAIALPKSIADPFTVAATTRDTALADLSKQETGIESDVSKLETGLSNEQQKGVEQRQAIADRRHGLENKENQQFQDVQKFSETAPKLAHAEPFKAPELDQKAVTAMAMLAGAFAMMGTRKSGMSGKMAVASMAGFFKGLNEGHHEEAANKFREYKTNMDNAFREHEELLREYDRIYNQKEKGLQQIQREIEHVALDARDFEKLQEIRENNIGKQIDKNKKRLDDVAKQRTKVGEDYEREYAKIVQAKESAEQKRQHDEMMVAMKNKTIASQTEMGTDKLSEKGMKIYEDMISHGLSIPKTRRGMVDYAVLNDMGEKGISGGDIAAGKGETKAIMTAMNQNEARGAAIDRITGAVKELEPKVLSLAKEVNTSIGGEWGNRTFNDFVSKFGDNPDYAGKITELRNMTQALSREYVIATRMPGSNAQMHVAHSEDADKLFNGDMPINKMEGAVRGINTDISAMENSIEKERNVLHQKLIGWGTSNEKSSDPLGIR